MAQDSTFKDFKFIQVEIEPDTGCITLADRQLPEKYDVPLFVSPKELAAELRQIANYLDKVGTPRRKRRK